MADRKQGRLLWAYHWKIIALIKEIVRQPLPGDSLPIEFAYNRLWLQENRTWLGEEIGWV